MAEDIKLLLELKRLENLKHKAIQELEPYQNGGVLNDLREQVRQSRAELESLENELKGKMKQMRNFELESEKYYTEKKELEKDIYSGTIKDSKELTDLSEKVQTLSHRENEAFQNYCTLMEENEERELRISAKAEQVKELEKKLNEEETHVNGRMDELTSQIHQFTEHIQEIIEGLPQELLEKYRAVQRKYREDPIIELQRGEDTCACGLNLSTEKLNLLDVHGMVSCDHCRRLVVHFD